MAASARAGGRGGDRRGGGAPRRLRAARVHGRRLPSAPRVRQAERPLRRARGAARRAAGRAAAPRRAPPLPPRRRQRLPPRTPPTAAPQPHLSQAPTRTGAAPQPAAPPAAVAGSWTDFRGPARDGVYRQRPVAATWPAGGPRLLWKQPVGEGHASFVIARGVAYTIEQRRNREVVAAYDIATGRERWTNGWDAFFSEADGRRRPARHADLRRRHPLRPRRGRRAARAAGRLRHARVAHQHPRRRRRREPAVGHVRRAPDRRRQGDRAARRPRRVDGRLRRHDRQGGVEVARRPAGLRLAHAGDARRPPPDRDHHRRSRDRRVGRRRRAAVELPVGDGQRDQHRAADRDRAVAALPLVRLWQGRRGDRADRRTATGCGRRRSGSTRG